MTTPAPALQLWTGSGSPYAWRATLALQVKGLDYDETVISFSDREHKAPEFLARNPRGKVPVLQHGDVVLYESLAILAYLERLQPEPRLLGEDAASAGRVWQRIAEIDNYLAPVMHAFVRPIFFRDPKHERDAVEQAAGVLHRELAGLEGILTDQDWLVGGAISAADVCLYPVVQTVLRAAAKPSVADWDLALLPFAEEYPALAAWCARVQALPGFSHTWPPHWGDAPA